MVMWAVHASEAVPPRGAHRPFIVMVEGGILENWALIVSQLLIEVLEPWYDETFPYCIHKGSH